MFKMMKKKKKTDTYTLHKFTQESGCEAYRLVSGTGRDTLTTHNLTFMLNFIVRLKESGHTVICDRTFCGREYSEENCTERGCVFDTGEGCLIERKEEKENE